MIDFLPLWYLFATNPFSGVSRYLSRSSSTTASATFVVVVIGVITLWIVLSFRSNTRARGGGSAKKTLFEELASVHNLDRSQCRLLTRVVDAARVQPPALVFVDPDIIGRFACTPIPEADQLAKIADTIFGTLQMPCNIRQDNARLDDN